MALSSSPSSPLPPQAMQIMQQQMVYHQLARRGITDVRVLEAMRTVPRHLFVPTVYTEQAYYDSPLPIGNGQTISQPWMVAFMAEAAQLKDTDKVLEIGTGCGYNAAVLSKMVRKVHTVEVIPDLLKDATARLERLGYENVSCHLADGSVGLEAFAPYDAILVTAGAPKVPQQLKNQLADGGRLIIPVSRGFFGEDLLRVTKEAEKKFVEEKLADCAFVPMMGKEGWNERR